MATGAALVAGRLADAIAEHDVPGVTLAWGTPGRIETAVAGVASTRSGLPVRAATPFLVGSITKTFTATTAMRLVERGILDLDAPIARYLPALRFAGPDEGAAEGITLRLLLSHRSGLPSSHFEDFGRGDDCLARFEASLADLRLAHATGACFSYSNGGFSLAGRVIEGATGRVFDDVLRSEVLAPLGFDEAGLLPENVIAGSPAIGHDRAGSGPGALAPHPWPVLRAVGPEGMLAITATELVRFGHAIADPARSGLLLPATVDAMLTPQVDLPDWVHGPRSAWALGWHRPLHASDVVAAHTGSIASFLSAFAVDRARSAAVAVSVNANHPGASAVRRLATELGAEAVGCDSLRPAPSFARTVMTPDDSAAYAGVYGQLNSEYRVTIAPDGSLRIGATFGPCLVADGTPNLPEVPLVPIGPDRFEIQAPDGGSEIQFVRAPGADRPDRFYAGVAAMFRLS